MDDDTKANPSAAIEHLTMQQGGSRDGGLGEGADSIQDQIIIAPEIMRRILEQLDLQTLKRVRLVCKSWLREAGTHIEKKVTVRFSSGTLQKFAETFQNGIPGLPQPFRSIRFSSYDTKDCELLLSQLGSLCPPLMITRFDARGIPLDLTIAILIESSASLEHLYLMTRTVRKACILARENVFPKLRALHVLPYEDFPPARSEYIPLVVARIVDCSPNLETYRSWGDGGQSSEILLNVDPGNVKSLDLCHGNLRGEVLEHILHVPFTRLESLRMCLAIGEDFLMEAHALFPLYVTVAKCTETLRILDLSDVGDPDILTDFLVCPYLQELRLSEFPESRDWLSVCFPALEVLTVYWMTVDVREDSWTDMTPFLGLKTLRANQILFGSGNNDNSDWGDDSSEGEIENSSDGASTDDEPVKFFDKFPALECFHGDSEFAVDCCKLKATGDPRFLSLLEGVKHLELAGKDVGSADLDLAPLAVLKGVESIAITSGCSRFILSLPYKDLPALKVIEFSWNWKREDVCPMDQLLEMAKSVDKIVVTRDFQGRGSWDVPLDLQLFFDSALNAEVGLTEWQKKGA